MPDRPTERLHHLLINFIHSRLQRMKHIIPVFGYNARYWDSVGNRIGKDSCWIL